MIVYLPPPDAGSTVIFADDRLLVADKPAGLLSVPGRGPERADCLVARVQREYPDALTVHRLDMSTSGLLLLGRGAEMHRHFSKLFRERLVDKRYVAVVAGLMSAEAGEIDLPLIVDWPNRPRQKVDFETGKPSLTRFRVISRDPQAQTTRVELEPVTGRSHQLRLHLASLGHPILGDELYGDEASAPRLLLHAAELAFADPESGERLEFRSAPPF